MEIYWPNLSSLAGQAEHDITLAMKNNNPRKDTFRVRGRKLLTFRQDVSLRHVCSQRHQIHPDILRLVEFLEHWWLLFSFLVTIQGQQVMMLPTFDFTCTPLSLGRWQKA